MTPTLTTPRPDSEMALSHTGAGTRRCRRHSKLLPTTHLMGQPQFVLKWLVMGRLGVWCWLWVVSRPPLCVACMWRRKQGKRCSLADGSKR